MALTKTRLLKHDFPVLGIRSFWDPCERDPPTVNFKVSCSWALEGERVLRRVLRRDSKKGLSRRHLEGRNTSCQVRPPSYETYMSDILTPPPNRTCHKNSKFFQKSLKILLNVYLWGEITFTFGENKAYFQGNKVYLRIPSKILGFWGNFFVVAGVVLGLCGPGGPVWGFGSLID